MRVFRLLFWSEVSLSLQRFMHAQTHELIYIYNKWLCCPCSTSVYHPSALFLISKQTRFLSSSSMKYSLPDADSWADKANISPRTARQATADDSPCYTLGISVHYHESASEPALYEGYQSIYFVSWPMKDCAIPYHLLVKGTFPHRHLRCYREIWKACGYLVTQLWHQSTSTARW